MNSHRGLTIALTIMLSCFILAAFAATPVNSVTVTWEAPTERENGDVLAPDEIGGYTLTLWVDNVAVQVIEIAPDAADLVVDGIDQLTQNRISLSMTATDTGGLESLPSEKITFNIHALKPPKIHLTWGP